MHHSEIVPPLICIPLLKVWGFTELNGERRHVRRIRVTGKDKTVRYFRLIYDYRECILSIPCVELMSRSRTSLKICLMYLQPVGYHYVFPVE